MNRPINRQGEMAKPAAYWIILVGVIIALITSFDPLPTGSYKFSVGFFMLGVTPYLVYGCLTETVKGYLLVITGIAIVAFDLLARIGFDVTSAAQSTVVPAIWLCLLLVVIVLLVGILLDNLFAKVPP